MLDDKLYILRDGVSSYAYGSLKIKPGRVAQSVARLIQKPDVLGSKAGLATYF